MFNTLIVLRNESELDSDSRVRRKLRQMMEKVGMPAEEVFITSVETVERDIKAHTPYVVIPMGNEAFKSVYQDEEQRPVGILRGNILRSHLGPKVVPTWHPNFVYQNWSNQEMIEYDLRKAWATRETPFLPMRMGNNYSVCRTLEDLQVAKDYILAAKRVSFDIETEGFDLFDKDEILCVQFSTRKGEGIVIPLRGRWEVHTEDVYTKWQLDNYFWRFIEHEDGTIEKVLSKNEENKPQIVKPTFFAGDVVCSTPKLHEGPRKPKGHTCRGTLTNVWDGPMMPCQTTGRMSGKMVPFNYHEAYLAIREIMESDVVKVAHNGKFDVHGLEWQLGIQTRRFLIDTMLAYHQFHEERPHNLEFCRSRYTTMPKYDTELKSYVAAGKKGSFATVPNEVLWYYGAADADLELRLVDTLFEEIQLDNPENGMWLYDNIDMPYNRALVQIENNGMLVDKKRFAELVKVYDKAKVDLGHKLDVMCKAHGLTPLDAWNNSNTLRNFLFEYDYDMVVAKAVYHKCKEKTAHEHGDEEKYGCNKEGLTLFTPEVTRPMRGMGFPKYIGPQTDNDEQKTDKKAFTALQGWCHEDVLYKSFVNQHGDLIRTPSDKKLSERELKIRKWKSELLDLITHYKQAVQAKNLFLDGDPDKQTEGAQAMLKHIRYDGRIHCNYMQLATTARLSASGPNLQNIANEIKYFKGAGIRTMFVPPPGFSYLNADYSSQEMRILAYLANEQNLMDVFMLCQTCGENFNPTPEEPRRPFAFKVHRALTGHKAKDLHRATAALVFGVPYELVTDTQRTFAKRVNFGLNYGQGVRGLAEVTGLSITDAKKLIEDYMEAYPGIRVFQSTKRTMVYKGKKIPNAYGRWKHNYGIREMKAYLPQREYDKVASAMYRSCVNFPVQSTPADIMGNVAPALADVWGIEHEDWQDVESLVIAREICGGIHPAIALRDMNARMVNLVHDNTFWEVQTENVEEASRLIEMVSEGLPWEQLGWYLPVDLKVEPYWGFKEDEEEAAAA